MTDDGTPEPVLQAQAAAEAIRKINHLTIFDRGALVYPSEVGDVVAALARTVAQFPQALQQMARIVREIRDGSDLYDDRGASRNAREVATFAAALLADADCTSLYDDLDAAAQALSHLGVRDA